MVFPQLTPAPVICLVEPFGGSVRRQNPNMPHVFWDDAAVTRGDGIFETMLVLVGGDERVYGVDHGLTFHVADKLRTVLWGWLGEALSEEERDGVAR